MDLRLHAIFLFSRPGPLKVSIKKRRSSTASFNINRVKVVSHLRWFDEWLRRKGEEEYGRTRVSIKSALNLSLWVRASLYRGGGGGLKGDRGVRDYVTNIDLIRYNIFLS